MARRGQCACAAPLAGAGPGLLVLLVLAAHLRDALTCDPEAMAVCLQPLDPLTRQHTAGLSAYTGRTLRQVCTLFRQMETCLGLLAPPCGESDEQVYAGVRKASNFLCGEGLRQYRNHKVCFAKDALAAEGPTCNLTQSLDQADPTMTRAKSCKETARFTACVRDAVLRHCGGGAALWVENVNSNVFTLQNAGCYKQHSNIRVVVIFALSVTAFVITLVITVSCFMHRRNRKNNNRTSLRLLTTSVEEQDEPGKERCDVIITSPCSKTNIYSRLPTATRIKMAARRAKPNPDDVTTSLSDLSATFREESYDELGDEIDQSLTAYCPHCGKRSCLVHAETESLLAPSGTSWNHEELHACAFLADGGHLAGVLDPIVKAA